MIDISDKKQLKRGIPNSRFYIVIKSGGIEVKVRNSKIPGVYLPYRTMLEKSPLPYNGPAKLSNGLDYLKWIVDKQDRRKGKKQP